MKGWYEIMKKLVSLFLVLLMIFVTVSCSNSTSNEISKDPNSNNSSTNDNYVIGFILGDMVNEFYLQMIEAGNKAAEDYGVEIIWQSCDGSVEKEVNLIENFILQGIDCIALDPMDAEGVIAACNAATQAGIPVITTANKVNAEDNYMTLYTDKENIKRATTVLCYAIDGKGKLGLLSGGAGSWVVGQREDGFKEAIAEFPDIAGDIQLTNYDAGMAASITENWINTGGIDGIAAISDLFVISSITAAENLGYKDKIMWAGNDGNLENYDLLKEGVQLIDHLTGGYRVGYWNVACAARICAGEELPKTLYLKCHTIMTDETASMLSEKGFECEYITPEEAEVIAVDYSNEYGSKLSTAEFIKRSQ